VIHPTEDQRLRQRFLDLKEDTERAGHVPDFGTMLTRAKAAASPPSEAVAGARTVNARAWPGRRLLRVGAWAGAVLAAAVTGLILVDRHASSEDEFEQLVAAYESDQWQSPTAGLLDVPGMELTRSVPSVGGPARGLDPSTRPGAPAPRQRNDL
jgi:hypothetical protein